MRALLFDFGGTLDADGVTWLERFFPIYAEAGLRVERAAFDKAFYASDDTLAKRHKLKGLDLEATIRLQVAGVLERLAPAGGGLRDRVADRFVADTRAALERNRPVLESLKGRFRLGIVSNFYGNLEGILKGEGLLGLFDVVADSGVVGIEKPEPGIFQHALKALDCSPSEALMVGDSVPRDMRGAERLDMEHILIAAEGAKPCCPKGRIAPSVAGLEDALRETARP